VGVWFRRYSGFVRLTRTPPVPSQRRQVSFVGRIVPFWSGLMQPATNPSPLHREQSLFAILST